MSVWYGVYPRGHGGCMRWGSSLGRETMRGITPLFDVSFHHLTHQVSQETTCDDLFISPLFRWEGQTLRDVSSCSISYTPRCCATCMCNRIGKHHSGGKVISRVGSRHRMLDKTGIEAVRAHGGWRGSGLTTSHGLGNYDSNPWCRLRKASR